jgi:hypothetical protein
VIQCIIFILFIFILIKINFTGRHRRLST